MASKQKIKKPLWTKSNFQNNFDLCSLLDETPTGKQVISKYFSGVWDIFKLNDICKTYLIRKNKEIYEPIASKVSDCLNKIADVFSVLQETTYPLYLLKMNFSKVALDADGPLVGNLRKTSNWFNSKIYELENNQLDYETLQLSTTVVREAAKEFSEELKREDRAQFAERRLIVDIAELYQNIHGEWPLRELPLVESIGPLDEIMTILGGILDCGPLTKLIRDFDNDLRQRLRKEQKHKQIREKKKGSNYLITI